MNKIIHKANEREVEEHGWLHSHFSFSFADHYDLNKMGLGMLRVLNDDAIKPGTGFLELIPMNKSISNLMVTKLYY